MALRAPWRKACIRRAALRAGAAPGGMAMLKAAAALWAANLRH